MSIRTGPPNCAYDIGWDRIYGARDDGSRPTQIFELKPLDEIRPEDVLRFPEGCILGAYRGSIAHNMYVAKDDPQSIDDVDMIGVVVPEAKYILGLSEWGSRGTKEEWHGRFDCVWYDIRKAFRLLLQGNPNIMSLLWLQRQHYLQLTPVGKRILDNRALFVGKHVYDSFAGYASAQLAKMTSREPAEVREYLGVTYELKRRGKHPTDQITEPMMFEDKNDCSEWSTEKLLQRLKHYQKKGENLGYLGDKRKHLVLAHGYDAKNAAHCIRLLRMAKEFLATGEMTVFRVADRDELLDIKAGKWKLEDVKALAEQLFAEVRAARDTSPLPEEPDREGAERLVVEIVKEAIG